MRKDFLALGDWKASDLREILDRAAELKRLLSAGERPPVLQGKTLALYFEKPSLRTRVSDEGVMAQLGGYCVALQPEQVGMGTRESVADVAQGISR